MRRRERDRTRHVRTRNVAHAVRSERGAALVLALFAMTLLMALGGALVILTMTETTIAARYRDGAQAFHAAEAALARALADLRRTPDWTSVALGESPSAFWDAGARTTELTADLRSPADSAWQPYLSGWLRDLFPAAPDAPLYVTAWVADAGAGMLMVRAHAYGRPGVRRMVEVTIAQTDEGVRLLSWRESR